MADLITALGLVLVIEGLIWALIPHKLINMIKMASEMGENHLRLAGLVSLIFGVFIVWLVRGGGV